METLVITTDNIQEWIDELTKAAHAVGRLRHDAAGYIVMFELLDAAAELIHLQEVMA